MSTVQRTPGGIRVCGHEPLTDEELAAVDALADAAVRMEEKRLAALSPEERAAEERKRAEGHARLRRLQQSAREDR